MSFVFDPDRAARVLEPLPALRARMRPPAEEGLASAAFAGQRITRRQIYRLLANPHYPHLREALRAIENAVAAGMSLKELLNAELRGQFGSFLAETLLADHLLRRGLHVARGSAGSGRSPDLEVVAPDLSATLEVYSPRSWKAREDWVQDVVDALKNADTPFEYAASVTVDTGGIPMTSELVEDTVLRTGTDVLARLEADLRSLGSKATSVSWTYTHGGGEMTTTIELAHIAENAGELVRTVATSPPGEVFQADRLFADVLAKVREKAGRRQAPRGVGTVKGLAVDVSRAGIDYQVETGRLALDVATAGLDLDELGLDFVALTVPRRGKHGPTRGVWAPSLLFEETRVSKQQLAALFDLPA